MFEFTIIFILLWWIVLFMLLPIKATPPTKVEEGHASSAPAKSYIVQKMLGATVLALILSLVVHFGVVPMLEEEEGGYSKETQSQ